MKEDDDLDTFWAKERDPETGKGGPGWGRRFKRWFARTVMGSFKINRGLLKSHPQMLHKTQKEIQKTVRIQSSLFTMNLGALNVYKKPATTNNQVNVNGSSYTVSAGVNWNQMSDRPVPHIQNVKTASGSGYRSSSTKSSITRLRPGALSPGGLGVDIKHNSYERYLNRLKGKGPLREATYSINPIYGSKVRKTLIIDCPC